MIRIKYRKGLAIRNDQNERKTRTMAEMKRELNLDEMDRVNGGTWRTVNTGIAGLDAAFRESSSKGSRQIGHIPNGTMVDTISDELVYDPVSNRHFVQVNWNGKTGWIASSIVGLPR